MKQQCKDCKYVYATFSCARALKENPFTGEVSGLLRRDANTTGDCNHYVHKWKFWIPKKS